MKLKELQKMVNVAWSPVQQDPIMVAAGSAAQQLDASFSTSAALELYSINLSDASYDLQLVGSQATSHRFHKVLWSPFEFGSTHSNGLIVGGCESGVIQVYSASKLLAGENALLAQQDKHNGSVRCMDYNPFQNNLLASGASESDIIIWDINNTAVPMSPGAKVQPLEDVQGLVWNRQVKHILASVFSTRCVILDLRKNEPIIKLSDSQSRVRWREVQWHPEIATQLWLASEDDQAPSIQLWDLRYATAPAKTFHIHQRGVLGLTWCWQDFDLVASCGKDNKIYCWNQNSEDPNGEILAELATTNQWNFDVSWCPRNPALIAGSSFDGNVTIYSIFGGVHQQVQTTNKIADSFPGMESIGHEPVPQAGQQTQMATSDLKRAPKWMKRPAGACFGFGGKLLTFNGNSRSVTVSQVVTDPNLVDRSICLEKVMAEGNFIEYCRLKADQTNDQHSRFIWYFLKANFAENPHAEMLNLLGYHEEDTASKFKKYANEGKYNVGAPKEANPVDDLADQMTGLSRTIDNNAVFDAIAAVNKDLEQSDDQKIEKNVDVPYRIRTGTDNEGLICEALLTGNLEAAVELCMEAGKTSEALILAMNGGSELLSRIQYRYLKKNESYLSNIISALVTEDWSGVVTQCTIDSWKEALVAALTHCKRQLPLLCDRLGERLQMEAAGDVDLARNAILCYICGGNIDRLVESWNLQKSNRSENEPSNGELDKNNNGNEDLQELVEVTILLQKALEKQGRVTSVKGKLADLLSQYASLLAAQGSLDAALFFLGDSTDHQMVQLKQRLCHAVGHVNNLEKTNAMYYQTNQRGSISNQQQIPPFNPVFPTIGQAAKMKSWQSANAPVPPTAALVPGPIIPQPMSQPSWNTSPFQQPPTVTPFSPVVSYPIVPPAASKPPMRPPPSGDLAQPPRPSSVSSQTGGASLGRSKYVLDPSVSTGSSYGQAPPYHPNAPQSASTSQFNQFNTQPVNQPSIYNPVQSTNNYKPFSPAPLVQSNASPYVPVVPPLDVTSQPPNISYPGPPPMSSQPFSKMQRNPTPPPGWNDPPALMTAPRTQLREQCKMSAVHAGTRRWRKIIDSYNPSNRSSPQSKAENTQVAPITSPIPGGFVTQPQNGYPDTNSNYMSATPGQPLHPNSGAVNYQNFQQNLPYQQQPFQQQAPQSTNTNVNFMQKPASDVPTIPEPPKQKPPIPEEYVYLQTVFEELKKQCIAAAGNPQTKRKLEDVSKRLEVLYDLLRERRLSPSTLTSLTQLVQLIQAGDYANGIGLHTQMVSGLDFSQIASFMPGIKVLLQSAMQLQVYLR
ncbi:protein transport protein Sec31A isoform X2 [Topomyia yanbarensis]|uniref:protein transport protein Sec31A isoform X2 n=1 Tax=Topomyia yanbarensis TaxID=2498891 RepID=UPI00273AD533|nr:protein transport protein Sec31A isoform X2 [Topomyia yanbarensis]